MGIPIHVNRLKIKDYIEFQKLKEQPFEFNIDRDIAILSLFTGKPVDYFNNLGGKERDVYISRLIPILKSYPTAKKRPVVWIKGKRYKAAMSEKDFSFNAWSAFKNYELDENLNLAKILALIYSPTPLFSKRVFNSDSLDEVSAAIYKHATVKQVYGMFFFYFNRSEALKAIFPSLFARKPIDPNKPLERNPKRSGGYKSQYGWYHIAYELSGGIPSEEKIIYETWFIEILTKIQYLKHRSEAEEFERMIKK